MSSLGAKEPSCQQNTKSKPKAPPRIKHNMHKGDHSNQSASQHPKVLLKMITTTNTFLNIYNYVQKEKGRKQNKKREESATIIPG